MHDFCELLFEVDNSTILFFITPFEFEMFIIKFNLCKIILIVFVELKLKFLGTNTFFVTFRSLRNIQSTTKFKDLKFIMFLNDHSIRNALLISNWKFPLHAWSLLLHSFSVLESSAVIKGTLIIVKSEDVTTKYNKKEEEDCDCLSSSGEENNEGAKIGP